MNAIDALKRLERAGAENSKASAKLHEAARVIAEQIEAVVPVGVELPRGYVVRRTRSNVGTEVFLYKTELVTGVGDPRYYEDDLISETTYCIDGTGTYLHGDFHCEIAPQTRAGSLQFAKDVAEGLLDEIAAWLESRAAEAEAAASVLTDRAD